LHDAPVHTWSVSFGERYPNELAFSSLVARHCGTRHAILELSPAVILHHLDETIGLLSDPIGDPLTVPNALLFREASSHTGIVLNGEGGDPCFGGPKNQPMVLGELYAMPNGERPSRAGNYLRSHLKCYDDFAELLSPSALDGHRTTRSLARPDARRPALARLRLASSGHEHRAQGRAPHSAEGRRIEPIVWCAPP